MRTVETEVFLFDELSEDAKERAIRDYRDGGVEYLWCDDAIDSLRAFIEFFGSRLLDYSIDFDCPGRSMIRFSDPNMDDEEDLASVVSQLKNDGSCQFTGYCADDACNDGAIEAYANGERDAREVIYAGVQSWLSSVSADYEYQNSDEAIAETLEANEYEFTENGDQWH